MGCNKFCHLHLHFDIWCIVVLYLIEGTTYEYMHGSLHIFWLLKSIYIYTYSNNRYVHIITHENISRWRHIYTKYKFCFYQIYCKEFLTISDKLSPVSPRFGFWQMHWHVPVLLLNKAFINGRDKTKIYDTFILGNILAVFVCDFECHS